MKIVGVLLIVLGLVGLLFGGISYVTRDEKADLGPISVVEERRERIPVSPLIGALALAGGVVLLAASGRRERYA